MFNISFGEILIIGAIGVIVIGPARLPQTARFVGHFIGRAQRQVSSIKAEIKREMALEDMKSAQQDFEDARHNLRNVFNQAAAGVNEAAGEAQKSIQEAQAAATGAPAAPPPVAPAIKAAEGAAAGEAEKASEANEASEEKASANKAP